MLREDGRVHDDVPALIVPTKPRRRRPDRTTILLTAVLAAAFGLLALGILTARTGRDSSAVKDPLIREVFPAAGDVMTLRQATIGVDFVIGIYGELTVDGQPIPTSTVVANDKAPGQNVGTQIDGLYDPGQGTLRFKPQVGATIEAFSPGTHRVTVRYWRDGIETSTDARTFTWTFRVT